jgi:hypothetical protein
VHDLLPRHFHLINGGAENFEQNFWRSMTRSVAIRTADPIGGFIAADGMRVALLKFKSLFDTSIATGPKTI